MRTNIVIDDKLMEDALRTTGAKTKREAVELGLRTLLQLGKQQQDGLTGGVQSKNGYTDATFLLGASRKNEFYIRANVWTKPKKQNGSLEWENKLYSYHIALRWVYQTRVSMFVVLLKLTFSQSISFRSIYIGFYHATASRAITNMC